MRTRFKRTFALVLGIIYVTSSSIGVFADGLTGQQLKDVNVNPNWVASTCGSYEDNFDTSAADKQVYIMGDSITNLAKDSYTSTFQTEGWASTVEGLDSRHIEASSPSPSGLDQLDQDKFIGLT
jgi:hypothetical protein